MKFFKKVVKASIRVLTWRLLRLTSRAPSYEEIAEVFSMLRPRETGNQLIRLGSSSDGGYLVPDDFEGITDLFSPGVGDQSSFEEFFARRGLVCHLLDASVSGPSLLHENFNFVALWLSLRDKEGHINLDRWVESASPVGDLVMQMDVEGSEYEVLLGASDDVLRRFRIMVLELHGVHRILSRVGIQQIRSLLYRLSVNFVVAHVHPNNCCPTVKLGELEIPDVVELTLVRKDRAVSDGGKLLDLPHHLDRPNQARSEARIRWAETFETLPNRF